MATALRHRPGLDALVLALLITLALAFWLHVSSPQLASDDVHWLEGRPSTDLDTYRLVPRLAFSALRGIWGPNATAARVMILLTHALNGVLVYALGRAVLGDRLAAPSGLSPSGQALVAGAAFLINPLTVGTLTWISCYSYVLGTCFAALALLAAWQALGKGDRPAWPWAVVALACFSGGLLSSHEVFFLPFLFLVMGWMRGRMRRGVLLCLVGLGLALLAYALVYGFDRYGLTGSPLFSPGFLLAYSSSGLPSGLALALGYPVSFWVQPTGFMQACFSEPTRWGLMAAVLAAVLLLPRTRKVACGAVSLALSYLALATPYLFRLYLTPDTANYDVAYLLAGRVLYVPFLGVALGLGATASWLAQALRARRGAWLLLLLPVASYLHAMWLYDPADFLGLSLAQGVSGPDLPRWNPYVHQQPLWLLVPALVVAAALLARRLQARHGEPGTTAAL
jgi:hypothetical protein